MKKRCGLTRLMALGMTVLLMLSGGCGRQGALGQKEIRIFLSLNEMDTFRQTLVDAATVKAEQEGAVLDVGDAQGSIETQVEQLKQAAAQGYDVILCSAVSTDTAVQLKMSAGDIPIVFFNSCPDEKYLEAGRYVYVGSDEAVAGQFQAEYALSKLAGKQEINVVLIKGPRDHSATLGRTNGVKQALEESGKTIHYVFEDSANWDTEQARELFELFLRTGAEADCVICNNDAMAARRFQPVKWRLPYTSPAKDRVRPPWKWQSGWQEAVIPKIWKGSRRMAGMYGWTLKKWMEAMFPPMESKPVYPALP